MPHSKKGGGGAETRGKRRKVRPNLRTRGGERETAICRFSLGVTGRRERDKLAKPFGGGGILTKPKIVKKKGENRAGGESGEIREESRGKSPKGGRRETECIVLPWNPRPYQEGQKKVRG